MDHPLIDLITAKIREAEANGEFENLAGAGKPLPKMDDPKNGVLNRIIKENGGTPEYVSLARELRALREELARTTDQAKRREIMKNMSLMDVKIDMARKAFSR